MQNRVLTIAIVALTLSITPWIPGGLSDEGSAADGRLDAATLPPVSLRSLPDGAVTIAPPNGTIEAPAVPAAAPPGLSDQDPWVDANGDEMFGTLIMGTNAVQLNGRALSATTDGRLQFDGTDLCLASSNCAGVATAQPPLLVTGSTLSLSTLGCGAGDVWKWTGTSWSCQEDVDTDTDTTYDGTNFALSDQTCASSELVSGVDASGNIACATVDVSDSDTLGELACASDEIIRFDGLNWVCSLDQDTDTTYTAGSGLALLGTTFSADTSTIQTRVSGTCTSGSSIRAIGQDGSVICEADDGITRETDPTVNALGKASLACASGDVAKFDGSAWSCAEDVDTDTDTLGSLACASDEVAKWDGTGWTCAVDADSGGDITSVSAGSGLTGGGSAGAVTLAVGTGSITSSHIAAGAVGSSEIAADSVGMSELDVLWGKAHSTHGFLDSSSNYIYGATITPSADGVCLVTVHGTVLASDGNSGRGPYFRVAFRVNGGIDQNDGSYGLYFAEFSAAQDYAPGMTRTMPIPVSAGTSVEIGGYFGSPSGDWVGDSAYVVPSYVCF